MRDQSHSRINGSAAAAFATICERNRNTGSVLESAGEFDGVSMGQRYAQKFVNPSSAGTNNSDCKSRSDLRFTARAPPRASSIVPEIPTLTESRKDAATGKAGRHA